MAAKRRHYAGTIGRAFKRFRTGIGRGISTALAFRMRGGGSNTRTRNGRGADYGNLTFQNDEHLMYRRKRAPRRVRRKQRRAFKRFTYFLDKVQGMRSCHISHTDELTVGPTSGSDAQGVASVTLYGFGSNGSTPGTNTNWANGDMAYIFTAETAGAPSNISAATKLRFRSAVLNLNIKNVLDPQDLNARGGIAYVDIYHVLCRNDTTDSVGGGSLAQLWTDAVNRQTVTTGMTAIVNSAADGVTPFSAPGFGRDYIIKKVRKIRLSIGQTFTTQLRDPGNYVISEDDLMQIQHKRNLTEGYIIVSYNPSADPDTGVRGQVALEINYTKAYHYTFTNNSFDTIGRSNLI